MAQEQLIFNTRINTQGVRVYYDELHPYITKANILQTPMSETDSAIFGRSFGLFSSLCTYYRNYVYRTGRAKLSS